MLNRSLLRSGWVGQSASATMKKTRMANWIEPADVPTEEVRGNWRWSPFALEFWPPVPALTGGGRFFSECCGRWPRGCRNSTGRGHQAQTKPLASWRHRRWPLGDLGSPVLFLQKPAVLKDSEIKPSKITGSGRRRAANRVAAMAHPVCHVWLAFRKGDADHRRLLDGEGSSGWPPGRAKRGLLNRGCQACSREANAKNLT